MIMDEEPVDLEPLGDFLDSSRAPEACMDLSELDGFLAGLAVGPDPVLPDEWLPRGGNAPRRLGGRAGNVGRG
jgi:uncharacterized protein